MITFTMKNYDRKEAWERRFEVVEQVKEGSKILLDGSREYEIVRISTSEDGEIPEFKISPIGKTLEKCQIEHDEVWAKNNPEELAAGEYPDFSFTVEAMWFFCRDVKVCA